MGQLALFGVYPWVSTWLTPLWLVSVGVVVGLAVLAALWGVAAAAARVPALGTLAEDPKLRINLATAGMLITVPIYVWLTWQAWTGGGNSLGSNFFFGAFALAPICWVLPYSIIMLVSRRTVTEVPSAVQEGVLLPLFWLAVVFAAFSVVICSEMSEAVCRGSAPGSGSVLERHALSRSRSVVNSDRTTSWWKGLPRCAW